MTSLRRQLLVWLLPVFSVASIASAWAVYSMFGWSVRYFMDSQLRVIADSHAHSSGPVPALRPLTAHNIEKGDLIVQIWDSHGSLLATSWPALRLPQQATSGFHNVTIDDGSWRVYVLESPNRTVQSVQSLAFREDVIREQALQTGLSVALLIPVSAVILWFAIRLALRRLEHVAQVAASQDENSFSELPIEHVPVEVRPLVQSVNTLLARLRAAFTSQRRFVQDAAHELRTPITAMHLQLENLKASVDDPAVVTQQVRQLEAGLARTKRLVEQLLRLARQEAPVSPEAPRPVQLSELLKGIIAESVALAERRDIDLGFAATVDATVTASPDELRSLLTNLLDNALRYTPVGGVVDVTLHMKDGRVTVEIVDSGPGIPSQYLQRVFDRFFRIEGTEMEGSGLGLAIARSAAERNHIELALINRTEASGLIARMRFRQTLSLA